MCLLYLFRSGLCRSASFRSLQEWDSGRTTRSCQSTERCHVKPWVFLCHQPRLFEKSGTIHFLLDNFSNLFFLGKTERIFDIADIPFARVADEEKNTYVAKMKENGSYQGYKPRQYWVCRNTFRFSIFLSRASDSTSTMVFVINWNITIVSIRRPMAMVNLYQEHLLNSNPSVNRIVTKREHPEPLRPFLPEIDAFARYNHEHVLHPILRWGSNLRKRNLLPSLNTCTIGYSPSVWNFPRRL